VQYLGIKAAQECQVLVAPTIRTGVSLNHMDFPGTITLQPETLVDIIFDMVKSLAGHGFQKIILLNGHGGNKASVEIAAIRLRQFLHKVVIGVLHSWVLSKESYKVLESSIIYHADERETSTVIVTAKHLVKMERAKKEIPKSPSGLFSFHVTDFLNQVVSYGSPRTKSVTKTGIFGDATLATEEKGRVILDEKVNNLIREINRLKALNLDDYIEG